MKKLSILIVEDGQIQREMLRDFLLKEGIADLFPTGQARRLVESVMAREGRA